MVGHLRAHIILDHTIEALDVFVGEVCAERYGSVLEVPPRPLRFAIAHEFVQGGDDRITLD